MSRGEVRERENLAQSSSVSTYAHTSLSLSFSLFRAFNIPAAADTYRYKVMKDPGKVSEVLASDWYGKMERLRDYRKNTSDTLVGKNGIGVHSSVPRGNLNF